MTLERPPQARIEHQNPERFLLLSKTTHRQCRHAFIRIQVPSCCERITISANVPMNRRTGSPEPVAVDHPEVDVGNGGREISRRGARPRAVFDGMGTKELAKLGDPLQAVLRRSNLVESL